MRAGPSPDAGQPEELEEAVPLDLDARPVEAEARGAAVPGDPLRQRPRVGEHRLQQTAAPAAHLGPAGHDQGARTDSAGQEVGLVERSGEWLKPVLYIQGIHFGSGPDIE